MRVDNLYVIHTRNFKRDPIRYLQGCLIKIGISSQPLTRFDGVSAECIDPVSMLACIRIPRAYQAEQALHARYRIHRIRGEWFDMPECAVTDVLALVNDAARDSTKLFTNALFAYIPPDKIRR